MKGWCNMTLQCDRHNMRTVISACFSLLLVQFSLTGKHLNTKLSNNKISDWGLNIALNSSDWFIHKFIFLYFLDLFGGEPLATSDPPWESAEHHIHIAISALGGKPETLANKCLVAEHGPGGWEWGDDQRAGSLHCQGKAHRIEIRYLLWLS